ncbi:MAG: hypothetical protein NTV34_14020 [Proteobacteria bacterium]|nr:hypothetical protein [Pseudomonadota bacterium]
MNAMATLPDAAADVVPTPSLAFRGEMGPSQAVYIYPKPSRGGLLTEVAFNEFSAPAGVTVMLSCIATYPKDGKTSLELRIRPIGSSFAQKVKNECLDVEYLKISNESTKLRDVAVSVAGFSYLGKP